MNTITIGDGVLASSENQPTVGLSGISPKSGGKRTTKTAKLIPEMAIEILEDAILKCQEAGIAIGVSDFYNSGKKSVVLVIEGCTIDDAKHLQLLIATSGK